MIKKLSLSLVFTFIAFGAFSQTIVSTSPENKNVILEEYTGIHCGFCPQGHAIAQGLKESNPEDFYVINIHVGGVYGDKNSALERWVHNFNLLNDDTKLRLTIENDDKQSAYTVSDLMFIHKKTGIPIVFDYHHHTCHPDGMSHKEALELAISTWPKGIVPATHVSEPRDDKNFRAHHDYIKNKINLYGNNIDVMVEAKAKELAVLGYIKKHGLLLM